MIKGDKINLRVIQEKDLDILFNFWSDIENRGDYFPVFLTAQPAFKKDFAEHGFWSENFGRLVIVNKKDKILGSIWYFKSVPYFDGLEIGYILFDRASRNKGCMTEALSLLVKFLFETKKINRLQLSVVVGNPASKKVAQKCGFKSEGIARQAIFLKGRNLDIEWFSLLREERMGQEDNSRG
ncbi:MAG: GNAT family N-acetyltransferase [Anaerolineae bacterium]|nr:GNAT family N-acetyltransferase [Anaerolineae bacterium]